MGSAPNQNCVKELQGISNKNYYIKTLQSSSNRNALFIKASCTGGTYCSSGTKGTNFLPKFFDGNTTPGYTTLLCPGLWQNV